MNIADAREKCKSLLARIPRDVLIIAILILAALFSFGLGYLAGLDAAEQGSDLSIDFSPLVATTQDGQVVVSGSGTKYYLAWCAGVDRITDANKVWFASGSAAEAAGYAAAANCDGL